MCFQKNIYEILPEGVKPYILKTEKEEYKYSVINYLGNNRREIENNEKTFLKMTIPIRLIGLDINTRLYLGGAVEKGYKQECIESVYLDIVLKGLERLELLDNDLEKIILETSKGRFNCKKNKEEDNFSIASFEIIGNYEIVINQQDDTEKLFINIKSNKISMGILLNINTLEIHPDNLEILDIEKIDTWGN